jgi:hypothetical protein
LKLRAHSELHYGRAWQRRQLRSLRHGNEASQEFLVEDDWGYAIYPDAATLENLYDDDVL